MPNISPNYNGMKLQFTAEAGKFTNRWKLKQTKNCQQATCLRRNQKGIKKIH